MFFLHITPHDVRTHTNISGGILWRIVCVCVCARASLGGLVTKICFPPIVDTANTIEGRHLSQNEMHRKSIYISLTALNFEWLFRQEREGRKSKASVVAVGTQEG